jgi:hypothetical protein
MHGTDNAASEALNEKYICVSSAYRWKYKLCCAVEKYTAGIKLDLIPILRYAMKKITRSGVTPSYGNKLTTIHEVGFKPSKSLMLYTKPRLKSV